MRQPSYIFRFLYCAMDGMQCNVWFGFSVIYCLSPSPEWLLSNCALFEGNVSPSSALSLHLISLVLPTPARPVQVGGDAVVNYVSIPISKCNDRMTRASFVTAFTE